MAKKDKRTRRKLIIYPLVASMLVAGACYLKPRISKVVKLVNLLENKFDIISDAHYTKLLNKGASPKDIPHIMEEMESGEVPFFALDGYIGLLNKGIPQKIVSQIPWHVLHNVLEEIEYEKMPEGLVSYFTDSPVKHSIAVARHNPIFGTDKEKIKSHIKEQLSKAPHLSRKDTDYKEDASQIDSIENINMLYLIKGYIDYFQDKDNRKEISKQIRKDLEDHFSEHGGLVIFDRGKYKFVNISPREENVKGLGDNNSYRRRVWAKYIGAVGDYHFHAQEEDSSKYAGPSGVLGDISALLADAHGINHYKMDCVITKIKGNKFNVDIYFKDTKKVPLDNIFRLGKARVFDLGIFDMVKGD